MLAFIYPNHDYTAAELAIKAQALAGSKGMKVYSPPRNYMMTAYRRMEVKNKLSRSKAALFLAHDVREIDAICQKELDVLGKHGVPVSSS
jgi:hypothetical protein